MKDNLKYGTSQLFNFAQDSYLERTSRPFYAVVFLLPFIVFYELGTIFINTDLLNQCQTRVVAFVWLQQAVRIFGLGGKFVWIAPPFVVIIILLAFQLTSRKKWNFWLADVCPMVIECILFAVPLIVMMLFLTSSPAPQDSYQGDYGTLTIESQVCYLQATAQEMPENGIIHSTLAKIVTSIGAGIYEELVFRLVLICVLMIIFQDIFRFSYTQSIFISVMASAALFSAHHHIDFLSGQINPNDVFSWTKFTFRTIAGVYFAILFAIRGFGITAGTHAFYDIIAVCLDSFVFTE